MRVADRKTSSVVLSGVLAALCLALLYLKSIIPIIDLSIYFIISLFPAIIIVEINHKYAWLFFVATSLLSLVLPINKLELFFYYTFFGYFGILKFYIEKHKSKIISYLGKYIVFITSLLLNYYIAGSFITADAYNLFSLPVLILIATPLFFIYDYIYDLVIIFYERVLRKRLRR